MEAEYKIIGGDGTEYGPTTLAELKAWIGDGRVANATQVWRSDTTNWLPAEKYTELKTELSQLNDAAASARLRSLAAAGFWARLGAYLVDHFLIGMVVFAVWSLMAGSQQWKFSFPTQIKTEAEFQAFVNQLVVLSYQTAFIYYPFFLFYDVFFNGRYGATPGKMAIGARIIKVDGRRIGYETAFLRWLASRLGEAVFFLGYLMMIFQPQKRALQDYLAGTRVVFIR